MRGHARWWHYTGSRKLAVVLLAAVCAGGLYEDGAALLGTRALDASDLASPPIGRYVDVTCASLRPVGRFENGQHAYLCALGARVLPVAGTRAGDEAGASHLTGRLREYRAADAPGRSDTGDVDYLWPDEVRDDPAVATAYLEVTTLWKGRVFSVVAILAGIAAIAFAWRWWRPQRA